MFNSHRLPGPETSGAGFVPIISNKENSIMPEMNPNSETAQKIPVNADEPVDTSTDNAKGVEESAEAIARSITLIASSCRSP